MQDRLVLSSLVNKNIIIMIVIKINIVVVVVTPTKKTPRCGLEHQTSQNNKNYDIKINITFP